MAELQKNIILALLVAGVLSSCNYVSTREVQRPEDASVVAARNLKPTFDSIYQYIFARQCISCHSLGKPAHRVLLDRTSLLTSPRDLVIPGDLNSGLLIAIDGREKRKPMPPPEEGFGPLKPQEIEIIRTWILNGAKD